MEENTSKVFVGRNNAALADPLLAPVTPSAPASSLFVINLCASIAPVQTTGKTIPGFETYKLYQVARSEDGRTRHRLRLGFFTSEEDAERALASVRDNYPTAFVTCLSDDDRRFARGFLPDTESTASWKRPVIVPEKPAAAKPAVVKVAAAPVAPVAAPPAASVAPMPAKAASPAPAKKPAVEVARQPEPKPATKPAAPAPKAPAPADDITAIELSWDPPALEAPKPASASAPAQTVPAVFKTETVIKASPPPSAPKPEPRAPQTSKLAAPSTPAALTLAKEPEPAPVAPAPAAASAGPFHVGKGIDIPAVGLSLESTAIQSPVAAKSPAPPAGKKAAAVVKEPAQKPAAPAPKSKAEPAPVAAPAAPVRAAAPAPAATNSRAPELDSTQTIRALTSAELNDDSQEKWYSIQLVVSERPVNLDAMPHLDIFEAYRVYSIANAGSGKIVYSLRLGFFREEVSAEAVSGYLRTFFPSPSVIRISAAEQARFKDAPAPKATAVAASKSEAKVIELNPARKPAAVPTVTMEVTDRSPTGTFKPNATGSFKVNASGAHKALATGTHKALKPAAKHAAPATKRSAPLNKSSVTGKHKALQPKKSLQEQLLDEARDTLLSESAIRKLPKNDSLLSRLVDKLTK